jgi:hypothetical protein
MRPRGAGLADRTGIAGVVNGIAGVVRRGNALAAAVAGILAATFPACAPAAAPVQSPPGPTAADAEPAHDGGAALRADEAALAEARPEAVATANLPPLPPPPARLAVQPLLADEMPTAFCPLGVVAPPPAAPAPHAKSHKKDRSEHDRSEHEPRPFHAAPRIMIDVEGASDGSALGDLQRTVRAKGYWPVRRCYESGLRRDQHLRGTVALMVSLEPSGAVTAAAEAPAPAKASPLADPVVAACVVREVAPLLFGEPGPTAQVVTDAGTTRRGEAVLVHVDVTLGTGDAPVFAASPIPNAEAVREALRQAWPEATHCYEHALESNPRAGGRMDMHFRVARDGRVLSVQEGEAHLAAADLASCVLDVYRRATLPVAPLAPRTREPAAETTLVYGLELEPGAAN